MTNYLLESKHNATQENHFVRICNQWVAGSTPVTSSKKPLRNVDFWAAFAFVFLLSAQKSKNSAKDVDKLSSGW